MKDYTELIKELRAGAEFLTLSTPDIAHNQFAQMLYNAADAIEELQSITAVIVD